METRAVGENRITLWGRLLNVFSLTSMTNADLALRGQVVFQAGQETITVDDVICAAHLRGELETRWLRVLKYALSETSGLEPDQADLQVRSEQFRMSRDLISAEETERWLDERGLTLDDFSDFLVRQAVYDDLACLCGDQTRQDYAFAPPNLREQLRTDLLFSGEFDRLATGLAWRIAAREAGSDLVPASAIENEQARFFGRSGVSDEMLDRWLLSLGRDAVWFNEMLELEALFRRQREMLFTLGSRERMLPSLRMPLMRFELELIEVDSRDAAREVFECVSADGESMEEVASGAGYPYRRSTVFYEDLPADLQPRLVSAMPEEVLDPIEREGAFELCRLIRKTELDLADDEVRRRVEAKIIESHFSELVARLVRWILPPTGAP